MGYRNYLGTLPKKEYNKIKSMTLEQLRAHFGKDHVGPYKICTEVHGLGKYVDIDFPKRSSVPFFKNKDTKEYYGDYDFKAVKPEFLETIILDYTEKVKKYYNGLLEGIDRRDKTTWTEERFAKLYQHVDSFSSEWNCLTPYDLKKGDEITTSWKFEYSIFELVRVYKTFDWKRNVMTWYGY